MHKRLNSGEQFKLLDPSKEIPKGKLKFHFLLSNLGKMPSKLREDNYLFSIEEYISNSYVSKSFYDRLFFLNVLSIQNKLFWSMRYNSLFLNSYYIDCFINYIFEILDILIE